MTSLVPYHPRPNAITLGEVLAASGYFADARQAAQAAVKVMAGEELGVPAISAMTNIHMVKGRVTLGAHLMAALLRKHPDYDYRIDHLDNEACRITFTRGGDTVGESEFTIDDAKRAGSIKPDSAWTKTPRNMLFARALTNGVRWYCPDLTTGAIYTPDELDDEVIDDSEWTVPAPPAAPTVDLFDEDGAPSGDIPESPAPSMSAGV